MPKRTDLKKVLIIGSGPIVIGQACEFDYSGTQAVKALREEGIEVVLINSNPATIMTDPDLADRVYVEPITRPYLEKIIQIERPQAILPTVGGQTALNAALDLQRAGILDKYNVELIGAKAEAIAKAEDRKLFKDAMENIGAKVAASGVAHNMTEAYHLLEEIQLPIILRPAFTLGGAGGGVCYTREEFDTMVQKAIDESPMSQVLIEKSILGWKEYELEVMRDLKDNVVIICSIENLDPMGIHTGDSITVAPQQTLSDVEYQKLRDIGIDIIREIGVETGGSNIQFAVNPADGEIIVIEMNPRVSRSSALASKATGFPIARIAAKLSIGYTLDEIDNDITKKTPASFEPSIDYIVTKVPRFTFEKFPESPNRLDTQMRSVGEAMAIGRTFGESFQKALRSLETGRYGWGCDGSVKIPLEVRQAAAEGRKQEFFEEVLTHPNDERIFYLREAYQAGMSLEELHNLSKIDPWFLNQLNRLIQFEKEFVAHVGPDSSRYGDKEKQLLEEAKKFGYSDRQLGYLVNQQAMKTRLDKLSETYQGSKEYAELVSEIADVTAKQAGEIRAYRENNGLKKVYKRVDTCAAEFESYTPYLYSTFEEECEAEPSDRDKVIILGGGPNRIGQGIEFDYCCCHASFALQDMGYESIMVNSNPETVSTDYDTSDRLYFDPLVVEDIISIYQRESERGEVKGVILQFGGQTPLRLARKLKSAGVKVLGTTPESIDRAEDREQFSDMIAKLKLKHPEGGMASSIDQALSEANRIQYPVLVRPSYVLGGRAMAIVHDDSQLTQYMQKSTEVSADRPVLIDKFLENAIEVDVDALCDGDDVYVAGIMEHIEEAGVHSGDSACILPPKDLGKEILDEIKEATRKLGLELNVVGLINIQFAIHETGLFVIEVNPRASRTVPFVSKAINQPIAKLATRVMMGQKIKDLNLKEFDTGNRYHVKEVVLPFKKFAGVDTILGPEMKSTGEVMGIGLSPSEAFYKAQEGAGHRLPMKGSIFISVTDESKPPLVDAVSKLAKSGFEIIATHGTADFFEKHDIKVTRVFKKHEDKKPSIIDYISEGKVDIIINIPTDVKTREDALEIRLAALRYNLPYFTTVAAAVQAMEGILTMQSTDVAVYPIG